MQGKYAFCRQSYLLHVKANKVRLLIHPIVEGLQFAFLRSYRDLQEQK